MEGGGYRGIVDDGVDRRHVVPLTPVTVPMVPGREDVEHDPGREGGVVPDGVHFRDRSSSL